MKAILIKMTVIKVYKSIVKELKIQTVNLIQMLLIQRFEKALHPDFPRSKRERPTIITSAINMLKYMTRRYQNIIL